MFDALANIAKIPELRRRILFTLGMIAVYRVGIFVTTPGVNRTAMREIVAQGGGFLGMFNLFSGGALEQLSIFALGIMPYVTASIVLQLMSVVFKPPSTRTSVGGRTAGRPRTAGSASAGFTSMRAL